MYFDKDKLVPEDEENDDGKPTPFKNNISQMGLLNYQHSDIVNENRSTWVYLLGQNLGNVLETSEISELAR